MLWMVKLTFLNGAKDVMYYTTREEARTGRRFYLTMCEEGKPGTVVKATVSKATGCGCF